MFKFDPNSISKMDWGVIGAGAIAFVALFLPWYGFSSGISGDSFSGSVSGWGTSYGWLGALLIIASGAYLFLQRSKFDLSKISFGPGVVILGASAVGTLIVALRWITLPSGNGSAGAASYSYGAGSGIILTLIVGLIQVGCAYKLFRASGEAIPWVTEKSTGTEVPPTSSV